MNHRIAVMLGLVVLLTTSGCYIDPAQGADVEFYGNITATDDGFRMNGDLELGGGNPQLDEYREIEVVLYANDGEVLYREELGTLHNKSSRLNVSISSDHMPEYVIFDSPNIWDATGEIDYFVRDPRARGGYRVEDTTDQEDLPVELDH